MKPLTPVGSPSPLRLLNKGPDYLRRQMDGGSGGVRGHAVSAVERLEADKAKYVKSRQVIDARQEPVLSPCATPPPPARPRPPPPPRHFPDTPFSTLSTSPDENDNDDSRKENRRTPADVEARNRSNAKRSAAPGPRMPVHAAPVAPRSAPVLRRSTGKRMLRPDSLLIYRQKKECKSPGAVGPPGAAEVKGYSFVRRLFQGSMREKGGAAGEGGGGAHKMAISEEKAPSRDGGDSRMSWTNERDAADGGGGSRRSSKTDRERPPDVGDRLGNGDRDDEADPWKRAPPPPPPRRRPAELWRSESDLRLRVSVALSEQERFFDYCGLDLDMVEHLGARNFLSGASSVDTLSLVLRGAGGGGASEPSEFSRHSGEGLFQEEVGEQLAPAGVSIIERNARVIKWLYGCRNAAQEGPKESTV